MNTVIESAAGGETAALSFNQSEKIAYESNERHKRLCRQVGQAIGDFNMIEEATA